MILVSFRNKIAALSTSDKCRFRDRKAVDFSCSSDRFRINIDCALKLDSDQEHDYFFSKFTILALYP
ncbi:hypothetical protein BpHYR1_051286 [Brachionus plicatilis]|uniref:Uncharacterized protein n=1 Tax=Brachionus plicatilis TaxID=10195 RepID=A0A3M7S7Z4_BRAPC|nr:hypothetical protein BpHYR1_051286 [Brachionus plicatilis]